MLTKPIDWELIRQQYDQMVKYATALRLGTAETEAILRRFTRNNVQHPTYKSLSELGRAAKTIFLCRYLHSEALRREINEGLNVVEHWNSANDFIFFARRGELVSNRREDHEISMLALHLLQNCMVYINTLMLQRVLARPQWSGRQTHRKRPHRPDAADLGARESLRPVRARHGDQVAHRLTDLAAGDTTVGSRPYRDAAIKIGLEGKMRHAMPNQLLRPRLVELAESLGALPHARLNIERGRDNRPADQPKKQRARLLKAECEGEGCGYTVRITAKWVDDIGAPHCPKHGAMGVDRGEGAAEIAPVGEAVGQSV